MRPGRHVSAESPPCTSPFDKKQRDTTQILAANRLDTVYTLIIRGLAKNMKALIQPLYPAYLKSHSIMYLACTNCALTGTILADPFLFSVAGELRRRSGTERSEVTACKKLKAQNPTDGWRCTRSWARRVTLITSEDLLWCEITDKTEQLFNKCRTLNLSFQILHLLTAREAFFWLGAMLV